MSRIRLSAAAFRRMHTLEHNIACAMMPKTVSTDFTALVTAEFFGEVMPAPLAVTLFDHARSQRQPFTSSPLAAALGAY
jgi:hypothetical protein